MHLQAKQQGCLRQKNSLQTLSNPVFYRIFIFNLKTPGQFYENIIKGVSTNYY